jgi:hypothetical protein
VAPSLDHCGLQVASVAELEDVVTRAKAYRESDARVRVIDTEMRITHGPTHDYELTSAYVGFVIPLMVELQHLARRDRP